MANNNKKSKKTLVTSALLYANGPLHLGHLVEYIQTDIYVRFLRLIGEDVIYCCADDTHGAPIEINAQKKGITPEELVGQSYKEHTRDFEGFKISFDNYYTTNSDENQMYSDKLFKIAKDSDMIYKKKISQLYCNDCERFLPDRYVKGTCPKCGAEDQYGDVCEKCGSTHKPTELEAAKCAICGAEPHEKETEHYFFKLSKMSDKLMDWLESNDKLQKEIVNSVKQWIKEGLQDWDISRDGPYFGFKIPEEDNLYYYVWWDAPIGYMASSENYCQKNGMGDAEENYWKNEDARIIHFIGKDIVYFHFLFWPAVLMSTGYNVPTNLNVHGFLTINGEKMSKSRGTFITAEEYLKDGNPEYLRYFFARTLSKKLSDIDYNTDEFVTKINNELVANIGNLSYRTVSFSKKNFDGKITRAADEKKLAIEIQSKIMKIKDYYNDVNYRDALREIMEISDIGNKYFQDNTPWKLIKEDKEKVEDILGFCLNVIKKIAILIKPIMPNLSVEMLKQIGQPTDLNWDDASKDETEFNVEESKILIQKIEEDKKEKEDKNKASKKKQKDEPTPIGLNLKVGKIIEVGDHPDAEKLYILKVDIGSETRQIVAGLKPYLPESELQDKKIILLTNLEVAKLRGQKSEGMLLAADHGDTVKLVQPEGEPGDQIDFEGNIINDKKISYKQFIKNKRSVQNKIVTINDQPLKTKDGKEIGMDMPDGSEVR